MADKNKKVLGRHSTSKPTLEEQEKEVEQKAASLRNQYKRKDRPETTTNRYRPFLLDTTVNSP